MMFDTSAYYGQPGILSSPFVPQGLFGHLQGQLGHPTWPPIGGILGHPQFAGCATPGLLGYLPGQYASPIWPTIGALGQPQVPGFVPPAYAPSPFGLSTGPAIGGLLGQLLLATQLGIPGFGFAPPIAGWLPQAHLAAALGRSMIPYQTAVPQMACAGV